MAKLKTGYVCPVLIDKPNQKFIEEESILLTDTLDALWAGKEQEAYEGAIEIQNRWYFPLLHQDLQTAINEIVDFVE
jgi:hypothetical protein